MANDVEAALKTLTVRRATALTRRRVSLQVIAGRDAGKRHDFDGRARIGTRNLADFVLTDPRVSGLHCEIAAGDALVVRDLGSKNGTYLGGYRVVEAVVPAGDSIAIGDTRIRVVTVDELVEVPLAATDDYFGIVGQSAAIRALTARLERLAGSDTTVLITGETGSGKERVAEALHLSGRRARGPLVIVDCGSLPPNLIESELFGHERGAFTGATAQFKGAFERADGGTLFLDEIGELPLELQPKLLRAIESRTVRRVGGARQLSFDVRLIAATNRDLAMEVQRGRFREDLYYRLAVVSLTVPALRERPEDIPLLAVHLLREMGLDPASCITVESLAELQNHDWPGNVRELRNALERAATLLEPLSASDRSDPLDSPAPASTSIAEPFRVAKQRAIEAFERRYVTAMLDACDGNVSECARRAGMDRMSIHRILQRLGMRGGGPREP
ncbi:MAG TPA: sigma 54-interacting transcriptional regulator [Polyangia bacterium]